ncbi:nitronate monooxygenase [Burkholderia gladioli]|uniref:nitronate monooxygenase n=1 Tax=Burkholderia gladioli TaxID=28095 RepID=UPI001FC7FFB5|nr:nitronate monooxygenase [Burkholderia gladioli]
MIPFEANLPGPRLADLCGVSHPVFLAGMAAISGPALVAAVAKAGGMGTLGGLRRRACCASGSARRAR